MKRIICLCVILLCSISFAFAQGENAGLKKKKTVVKKKTVSPFAEAEKAWTVFYGKFREIVKNRDKARLREIMSDDFNSTFGENKDDYLNNMTAEDNDEWNDLEDMKKVSKLLRKGDDYYQSKKYLRKIVAQRWYDNGKERSACKNLKNEDPCGPSSLAFEFRNGKWLLVTTYFCECE